MKTDFNNTRADRLARMFEPATVVLFAGLGGVCIGVENAYTEAGFRDRYVDLAVNHWDTAVAVHELNHPMTQHLRADVWEVDPNSVLLGRQIAYLHLSPDCVDFSRAKGSAPKRKHIRALADVGLVWAGKRRPLVITLENVCEFEQWGPLLDNGQPDPARRGEEFRRWCGELRALGYELEYRTLKACDYGTPTTRKRLFVIARCDGKPIIWPEKTHGPTTASGVFRKSSIINSTGSARADSASAERNSSSSDRVINIDSPEAHLGSMGEEAKRRDGRRRFAAGALPQSLKPYRTAAECIDWSIPMLSIFATPEEAKAFAKQYGCGVPRRPLKPKTIARIMGGLDKFVIKAEKPFIVDIQNYGWNGTETRDIAEPMPTVTSGPKGGGFAVVDAKLAPYTVPNLGERDGQAPRSGSVENPMPTVTGTASGDRLVAATLSTLNHGGDEHRGADPREPLATITGANDARALVAAMVTKFRGDSKGHSAGEPMPTITGGGETARDAGAAHALGVSAAYLSHLYGTNTGSNGDVNQPAATVTGSGNHTAVMLAHLSTYYGNSKSGQGVGEPMPTIVGKDRIQLISTQTIQWPLNDNELKRAKMVARCLIRQLGQNIRGNLVWVRDSARGKTFPLVRTRINGFDRIITDLLMRMFTPRELAKAQGFPADYVIDRDSAGKPVSKADQVKLIGNSVAPQVAQAIAKANVVDLNVFEDCGRGAA